MQDAISKEDHEVQDDQPGGNRQGAEVAKASPGKFVAVVIAVVNSHDRMVPDASIARQLHFNSQVLFCRPLIENLPAQFRKLRPLAGPHEIAIDPGSGDPAQRIMLFVEDNFDISFHYRTEPRTM